MSGADILRELREDASKDSVPPPRSGATRDGDGKANIWVRLAIWWAVAFIALAVHDMALEARLVPWGHASGSICVCEGMQPVSDDRDLSTAPH